MDKTSLGNRMKKSYENIYRSFLPVNQYYILRIDGKNFSNYTKGLNRPFDDVFISHMQETMKYLCEEIQGAQMGFQQSDEITIVFTDLQSEQADIWFGGNIQKIVSVAASLATAKFNQLRLSRLASYNLDGCSLLDSEIDDFKLAQFDARVFSISQRHEVLNNLYWRQQDSSKNSIQMLARSMFSHKELQGLNGSQLQDKMMLEKGVNWNDIDTAKKRGSACYKELQYTKCNEGVLAAMKAQLPDRKKWVIDNEIPIFSKNWEWFNGKIL
jgi:tRNA(His) 5'-end guanylyltransferase